MLERPSPEGLPRGDAAGEGKGDAVGDRRGDAAVGKATETGSGRTARRVPVRKDARALKKVRPEYTRAALRANIEGRVRFQVLVGQDGRVRHARLIKGLGYGLDERALEAVRRWRFQPATVDGVPVESRRYVNVDFSIRE